MKVDLNASDTMIEFINAIEMVPELKWFGGMMAKHIDAMVENPKMRADLHRLVVFGFCAGVNEAYKKFVLARETPDTIEPGPIAQRPECPTAHDLGEDAGLNPARSA